MVTRALKKIGLFLISLEAERARPQPGQSAPSPRTAGANRTDATEFDGRAEALLRERQEDDTPLTAGSFQLIGLSDIREALGQDWRAVANRVRAVAEVEIRRSLTDADLYKEQGEETFVVCFAKLDEAAAQRKAQEISTAIKRELRRQVPEVNEVVYVDHFVAEVDGTGVIGQEKPIAEALLDSLHRIKQEADETARQRRARLVKASSVLYRPILTTSRRIVFMFRSALDAPSGSSALEQLRDISQPEELLRAIADLDCLVFGKTLAALHDIIQKGGKTIVVVPVHFQTLNRRATRESYLAICDAAPSTYKKFILFEIYGVSDDIPKTRLSDMVSYLSRYSNGVLMELRSKEQNIPELRALGFWGVTLDLPSRLSMPQGAEGLKHLVGLCRSVKLRILAHGANTLGNLQGAMHAGVDYVEGQAVHSPVPKLRNPFRNNPLTTA